METTECDISFASFGKMEWMNLHFLLWYITGTVECGFMTIRTAHIEIVPNAKYIVGYHLHFLGTFPCESLQNCLYACQNSDYCRTANYDGTNASCSHFEENSFVGSIIASSTSTLIKFDLCPPRFTEPQNVCFGVPQSIQPSVSVAAMLANIRRVRQLYVRSIYEIITPDRIYVPTYYQSIVQIYDFATYAFLDNLTLASPNTAGVSSFDLDSSNNILYSINLNNTVYMRGISANWTFPTTATTPMATMSDDFVAVVDNSQIRILDKTTGSSITSISSVATGASAVQRTRIINRQLYVTTSSKGLYRFNLSSLMNTTNVTGINLVPMSGTYTQQIFVDTSGRLYIMTSNYNTLVYTLNGILLTNYTGAPRLIVKATKYNVVIIYDQQTNPTSIYEYP